VKFRALARLASLLALGALEVLAASSPPPPGQPRMLLLDGAMLGGDVIVVGERGTILRTPNSGITWLAVAAPATGTLTGISFAPATPVQAGWTVGHDALILGTKDGGQTWAKQHQGENLQDSFLDVLALDEQHVLAVGAYGLCMETKDGGRTWAQRKLGDEDTHFNRLTRGPDGTLYLAGESGTLLRSGDAGVTWTKIAAPYEGSFYGILPLDRSTLLAHGLRGHVHRSTDHGATWQKSPTPQPVVYATAVKLRNGIIVLGGAARAMISSRDTGRTFAAYPEPPTTVVAELIELPDGNLLALGEAGATVLQTKTLGAPAR
jgi:photosystem II stability/assembly factor-like uncharacterized protein